MLGLQVNDRIRREVEQEMEQRMAIINQEMQANLIAINQHIE
jgi:hypothetical protein